MLTCEGETKVRRLSVRLSEPLPNWCERRTKKEKEKKKYLECRTFRLLFSPSGWKIFVQQALVEVNNIRQSKTPKFIEQNIGVYKNKKKNKSQI